MMWRSMLRKAAGSLRVQQNTPPREPPLPFDVAVTGCVEKTDYGPSELSYQLSTFSPVSVEHSAHCCVFDTDLDTDVGEPGPEHLARQAPSAAVPVPIFQPGERQRATGLIAAPPGTDPEDGDSHHRRVEAARHWRSEKSLCDPGSSAYQVMALLSLSTLFEHKLQSDAIRALEVASSAARSSSSASTGCSSTGFEPSLDVLTTARMALLLTHWGYRVILRKVVDSKAYWTKVMGASFIVALDTSSGAHVEYIVDPNFRELFRLGVASDHFSAVWRTLPPVFVGMPCQLQPVTRLLCEEAELAFLDAGRPCPPWRNWAATICRWMSNAFVDITPPPPGAPEADVAAFMEQCRQLCTAPEESIKQAVAESSAAGGPMARGGLTAGSSGLRASAAALKGSLARSCGVGGGRDVPQPRAQVCGFDAPLAPQRAGEGLPLCSSPAPAPLAATAAAGGAEALTRWPSHSACPVAAPNSAVLQDEAFRGECPGSNCSTLTDDYRVVYCSDGGMSLSEQLTAAASSGLYMEDSSPAAYSSSARAAVAANAPCLRDFPGAVGAGGMYASEWPEHELLPNPGSALPEAGTSNGSCGSRVARQKSLLTLGIEGLKRRERPQLALPAQQCVFARTLSQPCPATQQPTHMLAGGQQQQQQLWQPPDLVQQQGQQMQPMLLRLIPAPGRTQPRLGT